MGRLPELWLKKAVSILENLPEGCLEQQTWPSTLLRKTVFHIPYNSKRRSIKRKKNHKLLKIIIISAPFNHSSLKKEEGEEHKTHFAFFFSFIALQHLGWEQLFLDVCNPAGHNRLTSYTDLAAMASVSTASLNFHIPSWM